MIFLSTRVSRGAQTLFQGNENNLLSNFQSLCEDFPIHYKGPIKIIVIVICMPDKRSTTFTVTCIYLSIIIFLNNTFAFIFQLFKRVANTKYSTVNLINHTDLLPTNGENIILGEGSYGQCLLRQYTRFNLKVVEKQSLKQDTTEIIKEAHIMQALAHKNIPTIIGVQLQKHYYPLKISN